MIWSIVDSWYTFYAIVATIWLGCGYVGCGYWYSYINCEYPTVSSGCDEYGACLMLMWGGPLDFVANFMGGWTKHGICWNWITKPDLSASTENGQWICAVCSQPTIRQTNGVKLCMSCISNGYNSSNVNAGTAASYKLGQSISKIVAASGGLSKAVTSKGLPTSASTEPVIGYRVWNLNRETAELVSCVHQFTWPKRKRLSRDVFQNRGIHATKNSHWLAQEYLSGSGTPSAYNPAGIRSNHQSLWNEYTADVAGEVYLWGEVTEHELGYVAEFAYPKRLWMPEDTDPMIAMKLEENYGVPVELRSEFKKHQPAPLQQSGYQSFALSPGQMIQFFSYSYPLQTLCNYCGTAYDPTLLAGCPVCATSLVNPFQNAAQGLMGRTGAQAASSAPALTSIPCFRCGGPYDYVNSRCPKCDPQPGAIVPYKP